MRDITSGLALIGIGFLFGGSVFLGNFEVLPIFFDGLAVFLIIRGLVIVVRRKQIKA